MKILLCPGLPRAGTTYLFEQLVKSGHFNVPFGKETNYFVNNNFASGTFLPMFTDHSPDRLYLDFSPAYLSSSAAIERIVEAAKHAEIKIIISLRNPIEQMFAHYLHDLKAHVATREWDSAYYPLSKEIALRRYLQCRSRSIGLLIDALGLSNIFVVNFHKDLANPAALSARLSEFLQVPGLSLTPEKVGAGGWLPYYIYGGAHGMDVLIGDEIRVVPPMAMVLVNGRYSKLWHGLRPAEAMELLQAASAWTRVLTPNCIPALEHMAFRQDFAETLAMLRQNPADYPKPQPLCSSAPTLSPDIAKLLNLRQTFDARVHRIVAGILG